MSMYDMVTKVAYALLTLTLLSMNFAGIPASYLDIETRVDQAYIDDYRKLAVLENVMTLDASERLLRNELDSNAYDYERQRAVIPAEFFLEENEGNNVLGYQTTDTGHCYIENVPALDGQDYAFYIEIQEPYRTGDPGFQEPRSLGCTGIESPGDSVSAPALLIRKANGNPQLPVQIGIYSPEGESQTETVNQDDTQSETVNQDDTQTETLSSDSVTTGSYVRSEGSPGDIPQAVSRNEILDQPYEPLKIDNNAERPVDLPSCDTDDARIVEPEEAGNLESILENEDYRVFCMTPGDYRDSGGFTIHSVSGTQDQMRWIRYYNPDMPEDTHPWNMADPEIEGANERVMMEGITFRESNNWALDRLRFDSRVSSYGGENLLMNRLMFYKSDSTVQIKLYDTQRSHIQNSVIGKTKEQSRCYSGADSNGITVRWGSSYTTIVDNEIFDYWCGDGVQYSAQNINTYGGVIQDNDFYLTEEFQEANKPVENAIDLKSGPADPDTASVEGVPKEDWTIVENNRLWGESNNMIYHWQSASGIIIRNNLIFDLSGANGFAYSVPKKDETNTNHFFYDNILQDTGGGLKPRHIHDSVYARNVIVDAEGEKPTWAWFADPENNGVVRNVFLNSDLGNPTDNNDVKDNGFYNSEPFDGGDPAIQEGSADAADHGSLEIQVKQITGPQTKTIPDVRITQESPHSDWFGIN